MKRKAYEKKLRKLQAELCALQEWVKQTHILGLIPHKGRRFVALGD